MRRKRRNQNLGCLAILLVVFCAAAFLSVGGLVIIPHEVQASFGPPSANLGQVQRLTDAWQLYLTKDSLLQPVDPAGADQDFTIRMGETANSIAARLEEAGLVRSGDSFRTLLVYSGLDVTIQAGKYTLSPRLTALQLAHQLQDATPSKVTFNILAGWRAEEIAQALPTSGLTVSAQDFLQAVNTPPSGLISTDLAPSGSVEGFLMPGSYEFSRDATAADMLRSFTGQFQSAMSAELTSAFKAHGLSVREAVILASIVQREAVVVDEQPMIASVFYNRLVKGMKLDSDPTVQFALGYNDAQKTWWTNPLSADNLQFNSPYNTYIYAGLPPGPIGNPGMDALRAVAYPAQTPYYYFRARCDQSGRHAFAKTYEEQVQHACP